MTRWLPLVTALFVALAACGDDVPSGEASAPTTTAPTTTAPTTMLSDQALGGRAQGTDAKLESNLYQAVRLADAGVPVEDIARRLPALRFDGDRALIEVTLDAMTPDTVAAAEAAGMLISGEHPDLLLLTGTASVSSLRRIAALDGVTSVVAQFGTARR